MTNIALILSGGAGLRAGTEIPKQYIERSEERRVGKECM